MCSESFSIRNIASATGHSRQKVKDVIEQSQKRAITYPLTEEMTDAWLEGLLYPEFTMQGSGYRPMDFDYIHKELGKKGVNLRLLHHEYEMNCRAEGTIPYSYRSFLRHYRAFAQKHKATMRIKRKPGQILEVDWAGQTGFIIDRDTGETVKIYVFVATLPCSQYSYVEGFLSMDSNAWITAHRHAYAYFQGVTELLVPDNLRTGVNEHSREKIVLNPTYKDMANHYQTVVMPARVRAPKDKPNVEGSVRTVSTWVIAAMRTYFYARAQWIGGKQMISERVENEIACWFFHKYLPEPVMDELISTLLPHFLEDEAPPTEEMIKIGIELISNQLDH
jgi:transposase